MENINLAKVRSTAENYYLNKQYKCSEAVLKTIMDEFSIDLPAEIIAIASGFPMGMGSGCTCGALAGGVMSLGLFFGSSQPGQDERVLHCVSLSRELHNLFAERYKTTCCRSLTRGLKPNSPEHLQQCSRLSGDMAVESARIIAREKIGQSPFLRKSY